MEALVSADFELVTSTHYSLPESLRVADYDQQLSWVDIERGTLSIFSLTDERIREVKVASDLSFAESFNQEAYVFTAGNRIGVFAEDRVVSSSPPLLSRGRRFNDGCIDSKGRLIIGSKSLAQSDHHNVLLLLEGDGEITVLDDDLGLSNGVAIDPARKILFSVDSLSSIIYRRQMDPDGSYGFRELHHCFSQGEVPDGIALTADGLLIVALWGSSSIAIIDPFGDEIGRVPIPSIFATSVALHPGDNTIFVAAASQNREGREGLSHPGGVWKSATRGLGVPRVRWKQVNLESVEPKNHA
jgi:sugar lactone lactonase YvrE